MAEVFPSLLNIGRKSKNFNENAAILGEVAGDQAGND